MVAVTVMWYEFGGRGRGAGLREGTEKSTSVFSIQARFGKEEKGRNRKRKGGSGDVPPPEPAMRVTYRGALAGGQWGLKKTKQESEGTVYEFLSKNCQRGVLGLRGGCVRTRLLSVCGEQGVVEHSSS